MSCFANELFTVIIGARPSPLAYAQVQEILGDIKLFYPGIRFLISTIATIGDRDQKTSLRTLGRTDFFTREIDQWVLEGEKRVGIHSAKDLAVPLTKGLYTFCVTKGVDSSDSLVLREEESLATLHPHARIATSSFRREEAVKAIRSDFSFCDIRGTIEQRLAQLERSEIDGVVIAEAALIRLKLTHLNRIKLPGSTAEGQGQLAVVGREEDEEIRILFSCLDVRYYIHV